MMRIITSGFVPIAVLTARAFGLVLFLFIYILCTCVYGVGTAVNEKIMLQNIADAASYSAAVTEADGLSRIAVLNRALSWTYIQMTRSQMDYIVHKWLKRTLECYDQDKEKARDYNDEFLPRGAIDTHFPLREIYIGIPCGTHNAGKRDEDDSLGTWWIGWSEKEPDMIRLGFKRIQDLLIGASFDHQYGKLHKYDDLKEKVDGFDASGAEQTIRDCRQKIRELNRMIKEECETLPEAVKNSALGVIKASLPEDKYDDYRYVHHVRNYAYPYENSSNANRSGGDSEPVFSAYRNTEEDELEFLSMSVANGRLHEIFGDGIDQWFVRGDKQTFDDEGSVVTPTDDNFTGKGIMRGYKSANRKEGRNSRNIYRGNHVNDGRVIGNASSITSNLSSLFSGGGVTAQLAAIELMNLPRIFGILACGISSIIGDIEPSAKNVKQDFAEQCTEIHDNYGLVAEYHWASMHWACTTVIHEIWTCDPETGCHWTPYWISQKHFKTLPLSECKRHGYSSNSTGYSGSKTRSAYRSCVLGLNGNTNTHDSENKVQGYFVQGHARIYGDDKECYDSNYTGELAKPVKLNEKFFHGANVVVLARRQRNLLESILPNVNQDGTVDKKSLYSIFNPMKNGTWKYAVSATRAAYRERSSATKYLDTYQTKYEVMSSGQIDRGSPDNPIRLYCKARSFPAEDRFGCPHKDSGNRIVSRLERTWNLCETDWDALFVPFNGYCVNFDGLNEDNNKKMDCTLPNLSELLNGETWRNVNNGGESGGVNVGLGDVDRELTSDYKNYILH